MMDSSLSDQAFPAGGEGGAQSATDGGQAIATRVPVWAKCTNDGHMWVSVYLPMEMLRAARLMESAYCPMCGERGKNIVVAKQDNGVLLESGGTPPTPGLSPQAIFDRQGGEEARGAAR